jgi:glutaredoxin-like YruB-family protein
MKIIHNYNELYEASRNLDKAFVLIYKSGAEQSDCALKKIESQKEDPGIPLFQVDVNEVRDVHTILGVTSAPSLVELSHGKPLNIYKGCQTESFYFSVLSGQSFSRTSKPEGKAGKRVTVYTTPTCTWCTTIKTYLKEKNIAFTEVNVAANPTRAEEMVKKSGQQGVPQTDINGQIVVGFDKARINQLLEIAG